jgi:hypothetical protein
MQINAKCDTPRKTPVKGKTTKAAVKIENGDEPKEPATLKPTKKRAPRAKKEKEVKFEVSSLTLFFSGGTPESLKHSERFGFSLSSNQAINTTYTKPSDRPMKPMMMTLPLKPPPLPLYLHPRSAPLRANSPASITTRHPPRSARLRQLPLLRIPRVPPSLI